MSDAPETDDFPKWTAYEGIGTIKEGDTDIFAHRNLSSLTERHNRAISALREENRRLRQAIAAWAAELANNKEE